MLKIGWFRVRPEVIDGYWPGSGIGERLTPEHQVSVQLRGIEKPVEVSFKGNEGAMWEAINALDALFLKPTCDGDNN